MFLGLKKYGVRNPYDGTEKSSTIGKLDKIDVARRLKMSNGYLEQAALHFAWLAASLILIADPTAFCGLFKGPLEELKINWAMKTRDEFAGHLKDLHEWHLIEEEKAGTLRYLSRYFAISKSNGSARAIFNGRLLSSLQSPPAPVGLPEIPDVLRVAAELHREAQQRQPDRVVAPSVFNADIRHFFHEVEVNEQIAKFFGVCVGNTYYSWRGLPMGWSHSPRIAQCISWSLVLHNGEKIPGLAPACHSATKSANPPAYIVLEDGHGNRSGVAFIWYDNIIVIGYDHDTFRKTVANINANRKAYCLEWSSDDVYSPKEMRAPYRPPIPGKKPSHPQFLGIMLRVIFDSRSRDGAIQSTLSWHVEEKLDEKCKELLNNWKEVPPSHRSIAKAIGILIWRAYVYTVPLVAISDVISIAGRNVPPKQKWDDASRIPNSDIELLRCKLQEVVDDKTWHSSETGANPSLSVRVISDSSGAKGAYLIVDQAGNILKQEHWTWSSEQTSMSIFLKELLSAVRGLEAAGSMRPAGFVHLGIDNSAAGFVLRRGLSQVEVANEMLERAYAAIPLQHLRVTQLMSVDNAADPLTRGKQLNDQQLERVCEVLTRAETGWNRTGMNNAQYVENGTRNGDTFQVRHAEKEVDDEVEYLEKLVAEQFLEENE